MDFSELNITSETEPLFIEKILIHVRELELCTPFESSFGRFKFLVKFYPEITFRTSTGEKVTGFGECSPLTAPWYNSECHRSTSITLMYISSLITNKSMPAGCEFMPDWESDKVAAKIPYTDIFSFISSYGKIKGNNIAKAGIEGAYWDAIAKLNQKSVASLFGGNKLFVETGTSVGLEETPEILLRKVEKAVEVLKAARIKIKVKPGRDLSYLEAIRKKYPEIKLMADANSAYNLFDKKHLDILKEFDNFNLMMIEQPGSNEDIYDHAVKLAFLKTPVCLDESILSAMHARQAVELWQEYSSTDKLIINIKPPRVGGYLEAIRIAKICGENGISAWCGGMFESALGKTANVHFSSRKEINLPGDHISQSPYFKEDVATHPKYKDGMLEVPKGIGWGIEDLIFNKLTD